MSRPCSQQLCVACEQIVLNTGPDAGDLRDHLNYIYGAIYMECVLKNPAYTPGRPFRRGPAPHPLLAAPAGPG